QRKPRVAGLELLQGLIQLPRRIKLLPTPKMLGGRALLGGIVAATEREQPQEGEEDLHGALNGFTSSPLVRSTERFLGGACSSVARRSTFGGSRRSKGGLATTARACTGAVA